MPAALLALVTLLAIALFPGDLPSRELPQAPAPVLLSALPQPSAQGTQPSTDVATSLVARTVDFLRSRRLQVSAVPGGFLVTSGQAPMPTHSPGTAAGSDVVKLSVGLSSSPLPAASGTETRFGGDGDLAWRLAYNVQRNVTGGLRDVLGYETYDRGVKEQPSTSTTPGGATASVAPWVENYPLFSTNGFESILIGSPGAMDLLAAALANAIADYLDPATRTPVRSAQLGWSLIAPWQPVEPKAIYHAADGSTKLALTFDGGASSVPTPAILSALRDAGIHATMFMTADFVDRNPDLVVQMARDGHEFGNHSATHPDMTKISDDAIIDELNRLETAVYALTGKSTRPWFRPPFGAVDDRVLKVAASQGYYAVMWTADSADWRDDIAPSTVASRILRYSEPGGIMIEHLGSPQSAQVLPDVLKSLSDRGFTFGTLSEVVGTP